MCCNVVGATGLTYPTVQQKDAGNSRTQSVAACCSVLQRVAACCSVLQRVTVCYSVLQCVAVCCSVLQCAACVERAERDRGKVCGCVCVCVRV